MIDFLQNNWGKLSGLAVAIAHFVILHKRTTPKTHWYQPILAGFDTDVETWSGFPGQQWRFGGYATWQ